MEELTVPASIDSMVQVMTFVDGNLEAHDCSMKAQMQLDIAVDELFSNIALYAYTPGKGDATVRMEFADGAVTITFLDRGIPYDPLAKEDPDITLSAEDRKIGGLGIFMVKNTMDDMTYRYENGQNILSITKKI